MQANPERWRNHFLPARYFAENPIRKYFRPLPFLFARNELWKLLLTHPKRSYVSSARENSLATFPEYIWRKRNIAKEVYGNCPFEFSLLFSMIEYSCLLFKLSWLWSRHASQDKKRKKLNYLKKINETCVHFYG